MVVIPLLHKKNAIIIHLLGEGICHNQMASLKLIAQVYVHLYINH